MKTTIYLVRHGEVFNPDDIFYGRLPGYYLSDKGKEQAARLGKHLKKFPIHSVYSSPLERTKQTAEIVLGEIGTKPYSHDERLLEVYSPMQGRPFKETGTGNFYVPTLHKQGGELLSDIWFRMSQAITDVVAKHPGQQVVLVSHGDPIMITAKKYSGHPLRFSIVRSHDYVKHAQGFELVFEDSHTPKVHPLVF